MNTRHIAAENETFTPDPDVWGQPLEDVAFGLIGSDVEEWTSPFDYRMKGPGHPLAVCALIPENVLEWPSLIISERILPGGG